MRDNLPVKLMCSVRRRSPEQGPCRRGVERARPRVRRSRFERRICLREYDIVRRCCRGGL